MKGKKVWRGKIIWTEEELCAALSICSTEYYLHSDTQKAEINKM